MNRSWIALGADGCISDRRDSCPPEREPTLKDMNEVMATISAGQDPKLDQEERVRHRQAAFRKAAAALKRAAKRYETTREAIAREAMAWHRQYGRKPTPGNRALARAVQAHIEARMRLQHCLYDPERRKPGSMRRWS
jgi:hypothetical protein